MSIKKDKLLKIINEVIMELLNRKQLVEEGVSPKLVTKKVGTGVYKVIRAAEDHPVTSAALGAVAIGAYDKEKRKIKKSKPKHKKIKTEANSEVLKNIGSGVGKAVTTGVAAGVTGAAVGRAIRKGELKKAAKRARDEKNKLQKEVYISNQEKIKVGAEAALKIGTISGLIAMLAKRRAQIKDPKERAKQKQIDDRRVEQFRAQKKGGKQ